VAVSWATIALVAGAYAFVLLFVISLLTASKHGEREAHRAVVREKARRLREAEKEHRDVA
jgi:phosphate/sulfate permease